MSHSIYDDDLAELSEAQLQELSEFIDPDNELLPPSERLPPQTRKAPTTPYDRSHLMQHLKTQAIESKVGDDYIPFVKKESKTAPARTVKPPKKQIHTEFDDMLDMLDEEDIAELASELGMHSLMDQAQSRGDEPVTANPSTGLHKPGSLYSYPATQRKASDEDVHEDSDLDEVIRALQDDDPSLVDLNLNNHSLIDADVIDQIIEAMEGNTQLVKLHMVNVKFSDDHAQALATQVLRSNCTLQVLNLESNRITPKGIKALMKAVAENKSTALKELRLVNQYYPGGARAEAEIAKYLKDNKTLTKLGYAFANASYRTKVDQYIMRNTDEARKTRASITV